MTRHVLAVDLKDDPVVVAAYVEHHRSVWPEVLRSLRAAGIEDMEIVMLGRRLVMIVEAAGDLAAAFAAHRASDPRVAEWEALMKSMQEPPPGRAAGEWWALMQPIFRLNAAERCPT
jgi:L-rhamnose mutarotase